MLFIDEIHRLRRAGGGDPLSGHGGRQLDIVIGKGPTARRIRLDLPRFTLVGATTRTGLVTGPLRDRFGFVGRLDLYDADELRAIVERSAADPRGRRRRRGGDADRRALAGHAPDRQPPAAPGTRLRRGAGDGVVTGPAADEGLELFGVDELGLDKVDRAILEALCRRFGAARWA